MIFIKRKGLRVMKKEGLMTRSSLLKRWDSIVLWILRTHTIIHQENAGIKLWILENQNLPHDSRTHFLEQNHSVSERTYMISY